MYIHTLSFLYVAFLWDRGELFKKTLLGCLIFQEKQIAVDQTPSVLFSEEKICVAPMCLCVFVSVAAA